MNPNDIHNVAIIGAGTMGAGICISFAQGGYHVKLYDVNPEQLDQALTRITTSQELLVQEGLISPQAAEVMKTKITVTTRLEECMDGVQFVIEAVPEKLDLKHRLFQQMENLCPADTILATNTSGLSITSIASACRHPKRVGGMHWANPAEIVPLVEVIRGDNTSDDTFKTIYSITEKLDKVPVVINKDIPGFASNRLQHALFREALHLVESDVISLRDIDRTLKFGGGLRYPWMGPFETVDLGGLDIHYKIAEYLFKDLSNMSAPPEFFRHLVSKQKLGIKSGEGFYDYSKASTKETLRTRDLRLIRQLKLIRENQE